MRSLEYKIKNNKVYFYDRTWEGIDRPDYSEIEAMDLGRAEQFINDLLAEINEAKRQLVFPVDGGQFSLADMQRMLPEMTAYLKKYGMLENGSTQK